MNNILDLYMDESGRSSISSTKYRFFQTTGVYLSPQEKARLDRSFKKWREKYLVDSSTSIHAVDLFESHRIGYRKKGLNSKLGFTTAMHELADIICAREFESRTYFVDMLKLRSRVKLSEPPPHVGNESAYRAASKAYSSTVISVLGEDGQSLPLRLCANELFKYHARLLGRKCGYINVESQKEQDLELLKLYHKRAAKNYTYGDKVVGIRLHTKASLDGGIELADIISYLMFQNLRQKNKLSSEMSGISFYKVPMLDQMLTRIQACKEVRCRNVTSSPLI